MLAQTEFPLTGRSSTNTKAKRRAIQWNDLFVPRRSWSLSRAQKEGASCMASEVEVAAPVYQSVGVDRNSNAILGISTGLRVGIGDVC
jgi:hypothetical protein